MASLQQIYLINLAACAISIQHALQRFAPSAATAVAEPRSGEHYLNRFGFGLKRHYLDPSQIEPPILLLYLVVPLFLSVIVFCVVFSFHRGPISNQPR